MKIRIYNAISKDGYILDEQGEHFIYFTSGTTEFKKLLKEADCILMDHANYEYLNNQKVLPFKNKFMIVVVPEESTLSGSDSLWFTKLEPKQIKREIKIQGYQSVLCLVGNELLQKLITQKVATEIQISLYHGLQGGGIEKIDIIESISKKNTPTIKKSANFEQYNFVLKKVL